MKISENWLREWVDPPVDTDTLAAQLTMAGLEVESVERLAAGFSGVVVAHVLDTAPHPQADRLRVCRVDDGSGTPLTVVCGAPNARPGLRAPLARIGALMPGGGRIEAARLRGVASQGMLCSAAELGLGEPGGGLFELPADAPVGAPLDAWLALPDATLEINLTPNRGDCLSIAGLAREVAVRNGLTASAGSGPVVPAQIDDVLPVVLEAPAACPVYAGRIVRGIDAAASTPPWLSERLRRCGLRSISAVVDVTNYVMLELGQPLHAFDLARLAGGIVVRHARPGERLELLDGHEVALEPAMLVIADHASPVALAGIMGGAASAVGARTRDVFLESAYFAPQAIAGRARGIGLHTDASHRFERGVATDLQERALERATELIVSICGGSPGPIAATRAGGLPARAPVTLRRNRLERLLGYRVPDADVARILGGLGLQVEETTEGWRATPPPWRFDLAIEPDLIEEVARLTGYDAAPVRLPAGGDRLAGRPESVVGTDRLRLALVERGYHEVVTWSFVEPRRQALFEPHQPALALANPISADLAVMRTSMWPGLTQVVDFNRKRQRDRVRVFELGSLFLQPAGGRVEIPVIAGAVVGGALPRQWGSPDTAVDFFDIKADVEALLTLGDAGPGARFQPSRHPALHPGLSADIVVDARTIGVVGALHPNIIKQLDLSSNIYVFQLEAMLLGVRTPPSYRPVSPFPAIRRDLSLLVDRALPAGALLDTVRRLGGDLLVDLELFDVYAGERIDPGKKSLAIGLIFQGSSRTLTDDEVSVVLERVKEGLADSHGALLRS